MVDDAQTSAFLSAVSVPLRNVPRATSMPEHRCNAYLERVVNALVRSEERAELFLRWQRFWQCMRDKGDQQQGGKSS